jgi:hypothetical protein
VLVGWWDPDVLAELEAELQAARVQREETRVNATEGFPRHSSCNTADDGQRADDMIWNDVDDDIADDDIADDDIADDDIADDDPFGDIC